MIENQNSGGHNQDEFTVKVICLTPIKNEAWILDTFLKCASVWADHIIIADQMSTDGSREIAQNYPKVILLNNEAVEFNEPERQKLLIDAARKLPGDKKILIALDADEILTGNVLQFRSQLSTMPFGQVLKFDWLNILPGGRNCWKAENAMPFGFIDNDSPHIGEKIHSTRIPFPEDAPIFHLKDYAVFHLQYLDWERMKSKHRWYECYERLLFPKKSALDIYRRYHHMYSRKKIRIIPIPQRLIESYKFKNGSLFDYIKEAIYRWDKDVAEYIEDHGANLFRNLDIWDYDWTPLLSASGTNSLNAMANKRWTEQIIWAYLKWTQPYYPAMPLKAIDKILRKFLF